MQGIKDILKPTLFSLSCFSIILVLLSACSNASSTNIYVIVKEDSNESRIDFAAGELASFLQNIYPDDRFVVKTEVPEHGDYILLGTVSGFSPIQPFVNADDVSVAGSFIVKNTTHDGRQLGIICGNDSRGLMDGVYSLLEQKLGYGFYLSYNAKENVDTGNFSFEKWDLQAAPTVKERITFNWHNFISGCTAWNYEDWKHWVLQSARMRYTGVMIHTYGWSPLTQFVFNGQVKKVEYIQNTRNGDHWGVAHTHDVRDLVGGEIFESEGPVFGAETGKIGFNGVTMENRVQKAKELMKKVSLYARDSVGMDFIFAWDVDTKDCNHQEQILTLDPVDRFLENESGYWLARPDTEKGYAFYKAQVEMLISDYPGISEIALWYRHSPHTDNKDMTPVWNWLDRDELPAAWQIEYDEAPGSAKNWAGPGMLGISKIADAFRKALIELGQDHIKLAYGSWWFNDERHHELFNASNEFFDPSLRAYPLDYDMAFSGSELFRSKLRNTGEKRELTVIEWAHHDDGKYCGRPYTPPENFSKLLLDEAHASGFGVIHWTTRPLDIFFKNLQYQVWSNTLNQNLEESCGHMALDFFGRDAAPVMEQYLKSWMAEAPQFNRETSPVFAFHIDNVDEVVNGVHNRLKILDSVYQDKLSPVALKRWNYFKGHEEWIKLFHEAHVSNDPQKQRDAILKYVEKITVDGLTRGEMGLLIQHNLKWLQDLE